MKRREKEKRKRKKRYSQKFVKKSIQQCSLRRNKIEERNVI